LERWGYARVFNIFICLTVEDRISKLTVDG
jgi:hypothetical protein